MINTDKKESLDLSEATTPQIYRILRASIARNDVEPGTRISESEVATHYNISRQPVREAFIKLAEEALVEVLPKRGTYIRKISISAVLDARFVREAIESEIIKDLALRSDPALVSELHSQLAAQETVAEKDNIEFIRLDEIFHRTLAQAAGREHAWHIIEGVKLHMDRVRHLSTQRFPVRKLVLEHRAITNAIEKGSNQEADKVIRKHLQGIITDLPEIVLQFPNFFDDPKIPVSERGVLKLANPREE